MLIWGLIYLKLQLLSYYLLPPVPDASSDAATPRDFPKLPDLRRLPGEVLRNGDARNKNHLINHRYIHCSLIILHLLPDRAPLDPPNVDILFCKSSMTTNMASFRF